MSQVHQSNNSSQNVERETLSRLRCDIQKGLDSGAAEPWDTEEIKQAARVERIKARAA
jgi:Arc/MetJ-type ribon-helix-helix transcriptional regulator